MEPGGAIPKRLVTPQTLIQNLATLPYPKTAEDCGHESLHQPQKHTKSGVSAHPVSLLIDTTTFVNRKYRKIGSPQTISWDGAFAATPSISDV